MYCNYCERKVTDKYVKVKSDVYCDTECAFLEGLVQTVCCSKIEEVENLKSVATQSGNKLYMCNSKEECFKTAYTLENFRKLIVEKSMETYKHLKELNTPLHNKRVQTIQKNSVFVDTYLSSRFKNQSPFKNGIYKGYFVYQVHDFFISNTVVLRYHKGQFIEEFNYLHDGNLNRLIQLKNDNPLLPFDIILAMLDTKRNLKNAIQTFENSISPPSYNSDYKNTLFGKVR